MQESKSSKAPEETQKIAQSWFEDYSHIRLWLLRGELGSGKTTFVQGIVGETKSPTFAYVRDYPQLAHYDLYRLEKPDGELLQLIEDHLEEKPVFVEWPQILLEDLPKPHVLLDFEAQESGERQITLQVVQ